MQGLHYPCSRVARRVWKLKWQLEGRSKNLGHCLPIGSRKAIGLLAICLVSLVSLLTPAGVEAQTSGQTGAPHLYFFTNDGCAPCRQVEPGIEALQREGYPVTTVKLSESPQLARQFQVDRTPTVILIANNRMAGRHAGLIDGVTLKKWFAAVGMPNGTRFEPRSRDVPSSKSPSREPVSTKVIIDRMVTNAQRGPAQTPTNFSTPTMHRGTARARTEAERRAMLATVRLKVEDADGISYATGTVIHTHGNESLVVTCGHVFRDSRGQGLITAEYNFYTDPERASGRLIDYDAGPRDVALVAIRTRTPIQPVRLAGAGADVPVGLDIFTLGCDKGNDPTIRHSRIKNRAAYDGSIKYDIFGRPVDGRSGGGLFSTDGQLLGLCNSQAVEVDEGIYTALETLHWELDHTGLAHLFKDQRWSSLTSSSQPANNPRPDRFADSRYAQADRSLAMAGRPKSGPMVPLRSGALDARSPRQNRSARLDRNGTMPKTFARDPQRGNGFGSQSLPVGGTQMGRPTEDINFPSSTHTVKANVAANLGSPQEVVITVRSKQDPRQTKSIKIANPTPELLNYLEQIR